MYRKQKSIKNGLSELFCKMITGQKKENKI